MENSSAKTSEAEGERADDHWLTRAPNEDGALSRPLGTPIGVAIIEEDRQSCLVQQHAVNQTAGYRCVGTFNSLQCARDSLATATPSILILDLLLPDGCGIAFASLLLKKLPNLAIIMVSGFDDEDLISQSLQAGVLAFLVKPFHPSQLMATLKAVSIFARRLTTGNGSASSKIGSARAVPVSKPRQRAVMDYLMGGLLYKEIAAEMHLSEAVIRKHTHAIYHKLHVSNRSEAIGKWRVEGSV